MLTKLSITLLILVFFSSNAFKLNVVHQTSRLMNLKMAEITPALVKTLRDKSGAGMMDCRNALTASNGDIDGAVDWLRKKGIAAVAKKSGRVTSSGLVGVATSSDHKAAAVVEINSETDFVARNEIFQSMVSQVCAIAASNPCNRDSLLTLKFDGEKTISEEITRQVATIGENMNLRRMERLAVDNGQVVTYMHNPTKPSLGKIGVAVALESPAGPCDALAELGKKLALHIAASSPEALTIKDVAPEKLERLRISFCYFSSLTFFFFLLFRERRVLIDQAKATGKSEAAIEKMVEGRIRKYYEEVVFMEQAFVMDNKIKVSDLVSQVSKSLGSPITVKSFARITLGEGVEKKEE
jgi:elongation factor Ts